MTILEQKEKNLNKLIDKLNNLTSTYSQSSYEEEKIINLQEEVNKKSVEEDKFNQDIEDLSQETEKLVNEIEKWQT